MDVVAIGSVVGNCDALPTPTIRVNTARRHGTCMVVLKSRKTYECLADPCESGKVVSYM
jgi:hypothetical protein